MSRKINAVMDNIFETLRSYVADDDSYRVESVKRHIIAEGDETKVCDFVKKAKINVVTRNSTSLCFFKYNESRFLLAPSIYETALDEIGFSVESDSSIIQGASMLAISKGALTLRSDITSILIIEKCLGVLPEEGETDVVFNYSDILELFDYFSVYILNDSVFELIYEEDINRLFCYLYANNDISFSSSSVKRIKDITLLCSSRSIAGSILNCLESSLVEYAFLQLYQCLEYLFRLNNSVLMATKHSISLETAIDIVVENEFKVSEQDNLYSVIKNNASETSIDTFYGLITDEESKSDDESKKWISCCKYIYKLRCNIAHLRYDQEVISDVSWEKCLEAMTDVIESIYRKRDREIIQICESKKMWRLLEW